MKKFARTFIWFLSPIILLGYLTDVFISKQLRNRKQFAYGEISTWSDIYDGKINADIAVYGSSRAWVQIDPGIIANKTNLTAYNLGIDGHNFWLEYLRHSLLLKYNMKPQTIILSLDMSTLQKNRDLYNLDQFLPYMLFNNEIENSISSYEGFKPYDFKIPLVRYYGNNDAIINALKIFINPKSNLVMRVRGYQGYNRSWNNNFDKLKQHIKPIKINIDIKSLHLFKKFLNECKDQNIKVIMVYSPEYIEGQSFVKNRNEIMSLYKNFSNKYNIPFYDYSNDTMSFQKKYFYNVGHLNKTGAELFTTNFIEKIKPSLPNVNPKPVEIMKNGN